MSISAIRRRTARDGTPFVSLRLTNGHRTASLSEIETFLGEQVGTVYFGDTPDDSGCYWANVMPPNGDDVPDAPEV